MIPVIQKTKYDCWRACIASILEIDIEALPLPEDNMHHTSAQYVAKLRKALLELGYTLTCYSPQNINSKILSSPDTGGYVIAIGRSPRGNYNHAVVWINGIVHDPHPEKTGILDIRAFQVIRRVT